MSAPTYRIAALWTTLKAARRLGARVVLTPEDVEATRTIKTAIVCVCPARSEPHVHVAARGKNAQS